MNLGKLREVVRDRVAWCATVHEVRKCWIQLDNWTMTTTMWGVSIRCNMLTSSYKIFTKCVHVCVCVCESHSVMSSCLPSRLLSPWDFPGKNIAVGCHLLLQGIFPIQGTNPGLLHCRQTLPSETPGKPTKYTPVIKIQQENHGPRTSKGSLFSYFLHLLAYLYSNYPWIYIKRLCIQLDYTVSTVPTGPKGTLISFKRKYKVFTLH